MDLEIPGPFFSQSDILKKVNFTEEVQTLLGSTVEPHLTTTSFRRAALN